MAATSHTIDYPAALELVYGRLDYERNATVPARLQGLHLDRMRRLLRGLGNPHQQLPVIHVAGTKGKGSTAAMLSSILTAAGYPTGLYTSPHLHGLQERMIVDGRLCSKAELVGLVERARPVIEEMDRHAVAEPWGRGPTFFEITTALALQHFAQRAVAAAVVEVGMGGRLDSTNVCQPRVSVITSISFDHTRQLGHTLAAIAAEKAGIIKHSVPVVSGVTEAEPRDVIRRIAVERGCPLWELGRDYSFRYRGSIASSPGATLDYFHNSAAGSHCWENLRLGLMGQHQAANAAVALTVVEQLRLLDWNITESAVRRGLASVSCPGRVEIVARHPTVVIDTAHNHASVAALLDVLDEVFAAGRRVLVFAATRDKDIRRMLQQLLPRFDHVIVTRYLQNPRAACPTAIRHLAQEVAAQLGTEQFQPDGLQACETPTEAWELARRMAGAEDLICIAGSFFIAAEMKQLSQTAAGETAAWSSS